MWHYVMHTSRDTEHIAPHHGDDSIVQKADLLPDLHLQNLETHCARSAKPGNRQTTGTTNPLHLQGSVIVDSVQLGLLMSGFPVLRFARLRPCQQKRLQAGTYIEFFFKGRA